MLTLISHKLYPLFQKFVGRDFSKEGFVKYFRNIQWTAIARVFTMAFSLVTTIISARLLGPEPFGVLTYTLSIVGIFTIFAGLGIELTLFRELTANKNKREEILGSAVALRFITGLIAFAGVLVTLLFLQEDAYTEGIIFILSFSLITPTALLLSYDFLKDSEAKYVAVTQIITMLISNSMKIAVIYFFHSISLFAAILVIENLISGTLYVAQIKIIKKRTLRLKFSKKYLFLLLSVSAPLVLFSAFSEIYARIDQIMLRNYLDIKAVGLYGVAVKLTELWYVVPNVLAGALFPALVNSHTNPLEYKKRLRIFIFTLATLSITISGIIFFSRNSIIHLIYGEEFAAAAPILGIYILSLFGSFLSIILYQDLFLIQRSFAIVFIPFATAAINITLNIILIPLKGSAGAALATVISYNLIPIFYWMLSKRRIKENAT
jgi:O-antigen/teichoic acid export membrane protein